MVLTAHGKNLGSYIIQSCNKSWPGVLHSASLSICVCGDVGREVIQLTHSQGNLIQGQGPYLLLTPYTHTHGVPHVDCEGPCAVTRTNPLLPPGKKALKTCPVFVVYRSS
jgi:hypothetical protein